MKKLVLTFSIITFIFCTFVQSTNAYVEEVSTKPYADKFKPSTGVKIKESNIAGRMENATRNAAYGGKKAKKQWVRKRPEQYDIEYESNVRSYKWF